MIATNFHFPDARRTIAEIMQVKPTCLEYVGKSEGAGTWALVSGSVEAQAKAISYAEAKGVRIKVLEEWDDGVLHCMYFIFMVIGLEALPGT